MTRFKYKAQDTAFGTIMMPYLPITLRNGDKQVEEFGLVDSGAEINVMPYKLGLDLGADWDKLPSGGKVSGPGTDSESRLLCVIAEIPPLPEAPMPSILAFRWLRKDSTRLILGQVNFFRVFNVSFYLSQNYFEVWRRGTSLAVGRISNG